MKAIDTLARRARSLQRHARAHFALQVPFSAARYLPGGSEGDVELIVVAFNNPELLPVQADLFDRHAAPGHVLTVADNSSDDAKRDRIETICRERGLTYIGLPLAPFPGEGSKSHGFALNWLTKHYVARRRPIVFGYLDHDIFPIGPFDARALVAEQPVYGLKQERGTIWYLWPGYCFFRTSSVVLAQMDFMPGRIDRMNVDTGGKNWGELYGSLDRAKLRFADQRLVRLRDGGSDQESSVEHIDGWVHMINGSYWMAGPRKEKIMFEYFGELDRGDFKLRTT